MVNFDLRCKHYIGKGLWLVLAALLFSLVALTGSCFAKTVDRFLIRHSFSTNMDLQKKEDFVLLDLVGNQGDTIAAVKLRINDIGKSDPWACNSFQQAIMKSLDPSSYEIKKLQSALKIGKTGQWDQTVWKALASKHNIPSGEIITVAGQKLGIIDTDDLPLSRSISKVLNTLENPYKTPSRMPSELVRDILKYSTFSLTNINPTTPAVSDTDPASVAQTLAEENTNLSYENVQLKKQLEQLKTENQGLTDRGQQAQSREQALKEAVTDLELESNRYRETIDKLKQQMQQQQTPDAKAPKEAPKQAARPVKSNNSTELWLLLGVIMAPLSLIVVLLWSDRKKREEALALQKAIYSQTRRMEPDALQKAVETGLERGERKLLQVQNTRFAKVDNNLERLFTNIESLGGEKLNALNADLEKEVKQSITAVSNVKDELKILIDERLAQIEASVKPLPKDQDLNNLKKELEQQHKQFVDAMEILKKTDEDLLARLGESHQGLDGESVERAVQGALDGQLAQVHEKLQAVLTRVQSLTEVVEEETNPFMNEVINRIDLVRKAVEKP